MVLIKKSYSLNTRYALLLWHFLLNCSQVNATEYLRWWVNFGQWDGLGQWYGVDPNGCPSNVITPTEVSNEVIYAISSNYTRDNIHERHSAIFAWQLPGQQYIWKQNDTCFKYTVVAKSRKCPCIMLQMHPMGLLPDTQNCGLCTRREYRERYPYKSGLAIPTCLTARVWRTCHGACLDH